MKPISFLSLLAKHIIANYSATIEDLVVVLPNKRAKVFLLEELKKEISEILPYYMIPSDIVVIDKFPYNTNHKIDKNALIEIYRGL